MTSTANSTPDLIWVTVPDYSTYIINQYGYLRYAETNMPVQYEIGLGDKWYRIHTDENVVHRVSRAQLLEDAFP